MSSRMPQPLVIDGTELDISVYTTENTFYTPRSWTADGQTYRCDALAGADADAAGAAPGAWVTVRALPSADQRLRLQVACAHPRAIKGIKIALTIPYMKMLAPEQIDLAEATWRQWDFPRDWRAGFAVWQRDGGYFSVVTREIPWRFKRMRALKMGDRMRLEIIQDANLRQRGCTFESSVWEIGFSDEIDSILEDYARFVAQGFGALPFRRRRDMPDWMSGVGLCVNLHGADWNGRIHLDYAGMREVCDVLAPLFPAERTILYPIGWDGRYMRRYPDYQAVDVLGGHEGFLSFCSHARELGFHVMPHLNAMAANMQHPHYLQHLKDYVIRDWNGIQRHSYHIDWDEEGLGDAAHAYIALPPLGLREILYAASDRLIRTYGIDGIFLDETCNVFYNDPAWDQVEGVRRLVRELQLQHPEVLIVGEEWNEMLLGITPVVQIWEETQDGRKSFGRERSPLMRKWAGQFIRAVGYLALASPDGQTGVHEWPDVPWVDERQNEEYYIPTLSITKNTLRDGMAGIRATVERAQDYLKRFVAT